MANGSRIVAPVVISQGQPSTMTGLDTGGSDRGKMGLLPSDMPSNTGKLSCPYDAAARQRMMNQYSKVIPFYSYGTKFPELSNFYMRDIYIEGKVYSSNEQYLVVRKAELCGQLSIAEEVWSLDTPSSIKSIGSTLVFAGGEQQWKTAAIGILWTANFAKFNQHGDLRDVLLKTQGTLLAEASGDEYWACGFFPNRLKDVANIAKWTGKNHMGFLLTYLRGILMRSMRFETNTDHLLKTGLRPNAGDRGKRRASSEASTSTEKPRTSKKDRKAAR